MYCAELEGDERGPAPDLAMGAEYCFVGIAVDESGNIVGVGCTAARVGESDPVDVILSPADGVNRATTCGPEVMLDSGREDSGRPDTGMMDSALPDTGVIDTGVVDTGTPDSGPTEATITVIPAQGGGASVRNIATGRTWSFDYPVVFELNTIVGTSYQISPRTGTFDSFTGGGCEGMNPCVHNVVGSTTIRLSFL